MSKKKEIRSCLIIVFTPLIIIGTIIFLLTNNWSMIPRTNTLRICLKSRVLSETGYAAMVTNNNRIYYISNELGATGIYSMDMDGSNIQLEVKNPSITGMQWRDNILYFVGLEKIEDRRSSLPWSDHVYTVYEKKKEEKRESNTELVDREENVKGFYKISDHVTAINYGYTDEISFYTDEQTLYSFGQEVPAPAGIKEKNIICFEGAVTEPEPLEKGIKAEVSIYVNAIENLYVIVCDDFSSEEMPWYQAYLFDVETGERIFINDVQDRFSDFQPLFLDDNYLYSFYKDPYFSKTGQMVIVNRENWEVEQMFPLGDIAETHRVSYAVKRDGKIYMLAEQWSSDDKAVLPLKNQKLLAMDPETFEWEVVRDMKEGERIVGLDERGIVYLADGGIWKAEWEGEALGGETRLCDAPKDIDKEKYTIDYAGDWMFVYKVYGGFTTGNIDDDPGQQLVYKINLKTGEVVENTVPLDFSQVDPYRRDSKTK